MTWTRPLCTYSYLQNSYFATLHHFSTILEMHPLKSIYAVSRIPPRRVRLACLMKYFNPETSWYLLLLAPCDFFSVTIHFTWYLSWFLKLVILTIFMKKLTPWVLACQALPSKIKWNHVLVLLKWLLIYKASLKIRCYFL